MTVNGIIKCEEGIHIPNVCFGSQSQFESFFLRDHFSAVNIHSQSKIPEAYDHSV